MASTASRLCSACGLCCNGVLFYTVHLKPGDSARTLSALGLKLKKKQGQQYLQQPCRAHRECSCSIYNDRPTRCRAFDCRLLLEVRAGVLAEAEALAHIAEAKDRVARLNQLLARPGNTRAGQPLFKRCDSALADPPYSRDSRERHLAMERERRELDELLDHRFRAPSERVSTEAESGSLR